MTNNYKNGWIIRYHHFRTNASSHTNFSGIHGGYILSLLDQIALPVLLNFQNYCVTASVDTVDFLTIEVGRVSHNEG
jgi:acyl-CoA hydrolase